MVTAGFLQLKFQYPRVSPGDCLLTNKPKDSEDEFVQQKDYWDKQLTLKVNDWSNAVTKTTTKMSKLHKLFWKYFTNGLGRPDKFGLRRTCIHFKKVINEAPFHPYGFLSITWTKESCHKSVKYDRPGECSPEKDCPGIDWRFNKLSGSHHQRI